MLVGHITDAKKLHLEIVRWENRRREVEARLEIIRSDMERSVERRKGKQRALDQMQLQMRWGEMR